MCRPCLNTAHVYKDDVILNLEVRYLCGISSRLLFIIQKKMCVSQTNKVPLTTKRRVLKSTNGYLFQGVIPIFLWLLFLWSIFLWPNHLRVDIPTKNLLKYRSILMLIDFSKTTNHYFNSPMSLCVDISTDQSSYVSIFLQTKAPMCRYSYRPKFLCVDITTDQSSYVSIFLQTKAPMCRYSYRPKFLCVDITTDQSSYVSIFLQRLPVISTN
jgi:hypothetical protein